MSNMIIANGADHGKSETFDRKCRSRGWLRLMLHSHDMVMKLFWLSVYYGDETTYIEEHTDHVL